jgi:hypothetical protein
MRLFILPCSIISPKAAKFSWYIEDRMNPFIYIAKEGAIRLLLMFFCLFIWDDINNDSSADSTSSAVDAGIETAIIIGFFVVFSIALLVEYSILAVISYWIKSNTVFFVCRLVFANLIYWRDLYRHGFDDILSKNSYLFLASMIVPLLLAQWILGWRLLAVLRGGLYSK